MPADPDPDQEALAAKRKSLKSQLAAHYKVLNQRCIDAGKQISTTEALGTDHHIALMREMFKKAQTTMDKIMEIYCEVLPLEEDSQRTTQTYDSYLATFSDVKDKLDAAEKKVTQPQASAVVPTQQTGGPNDRKPGDPKANDLLKPKELEYDDKPSVLRLWKKDFQDYYEKNNLDLHTDRIQQKYFQQCVSYKLRMKLRTMIRETTPVLAVDHQPGDPEPDSCFKFLDDIFKASYPLVRRRQDFFNYTQRPNQKTSDYLDKLRELFDEGEFQEFYCEKKI